MLNVHELKAQDLHGLSPSSLAQVAAQMLQRIGEQREADCLAGAGHQVQGRQARAHHVRAGAPRSLEVRGQDRGHERGAAPTLSRRRCSADEASLEAQLQALQAQAGAQPGARLRPSRSAAPSGQALPEHLVRLEHRHEPADTTCPSPDCGQPMVRVGQDVSERLDIVPAQFFVHRHIRGKWACRCCELLVQEPVEPQIIDSGMPAAGLVAHTLVSRFIDHLPYYRKEQINARSGVHTPRSTLAGRGPGAVAPRCSRCWTRTRHSCSARRCCTPMRRR